MEFRLLNKEEIDVRLGQVGDGYCTLLLYKDARVDMNILDDTVGGERWQRRHYEVKENMYCSVGIYFEGVGWVWKDDCGTESNTEKEKGESSDSFKRACVNWGIGRELYTAPVIKVNCATKKETKNGKEVFKISYLTAFTVSDIAYENKIIVKLEIKAYDRENRTNDVVFSFNSKERKVVKPLTLEEAKAQQVNTKQGVKKIEDLTNDELTILLSFDKNPKWQECAKLVLEDRKNAK